ncbi:MAG: methylmalonyl-CoA mutase [Methyloprofundus sp.]|nr:methylmalonyl-CoA mutase [Methyloprofundus sp.]
MAWEKHVEQELRGKKASSLDWEAAEGIKVKPLYSAEDLEGLEHLGSLPGAPPFVRGPYASMYPGRPWTIRQYTGFSTAKESNTFYRKNLAAGQKGLSIAFDLATHRGYDSDNPRVAGDVGKAGVAIDTVEDMKILFDGIPLDKMSVSMTMNGAVIPILASYIVAAEEQGVKQDQLLGTIQNDILKEYLCRNTYIYPPEPSMRIIADIISYCSANMPHYNCVSISGYHIAESGANCVLQTAYTIADGLEYVKTAIRSGLQVDDFAPRLSFFFGIGMNFFMNIAMLRAARFLWSEEMQQFNPKNEKSRMLRTHCQTSGWSLSEHDPYNNIVRTTIECMSAVLGETQSLHTNAYDEALGLPTEFSERIARNTQLIVQQESQICRVIDPLAGSYYLESLTGSIIKAARAVMQEVSDVGGMAEAIAAEIPQRRIEEAAIRTQARIELGKDVIIGENQYKLAEEADVPVREVSDAAREQQILALKHIKKTRNNVAVQQALDHITELAAAEGNLLQAAIVATRLRATVGEISTAMEKVFGRHQTQAEIITGAYASVYAKDEHFQAVQQQIKGIAEKLGRKPCVLTAKMGQDGHDRGLKVVSSAFADLGFEIMISPMFQTPAEVAKQAIEHDVHIIGISTLAAGHKTLVPMLMEELKKQGGEGIKLVVGGVIPHQDYDFLYSLGVVAIFGPGTNILDAAERILATIK